ncbi:MAG: cellulase family glycosylhydrolase [Pseudomonadota bacterium]
MNIHRLNAIPTRNTGKVSLTRKTISTLLKTLGGLALLGCIASASAVAPITVSGNKVLFGGQVGSVAGNSMFWSNTGWGQEKYYNANVVSWLKNDWKSKLVRAAMGADTEAGGGYLTDTSNKTRVFALVDAAIANDMYVIIDWHSHTAHQTRAQAITFFKEMATKYGHTNNVIYEIFNEPKQISWANDVKPYAQAVISAIREIDPDNLIVVGTPTWSQDVDVASTSPITGYANIAYTLHFYAGTHGQSLRNKAQTALNNGIALFVTEWGSVNADGNGAVNYGETEAWVAFMKANNISNANWALSDKAEGSSALVPGASNTGGWTSNQLTASGALAKDIISNWPSTGGGTDDPVVPACTTVNLPGTIQAENTCKMSGIKLETTSDLGDGKNVGWIDAGDWMTYKVNIPAAGSYKVSYRVASLNGGGVIQLEKAGGSPLYGTVNVPSTGGWQTWVTITHVVSLPAGVQEIGLAAKSGGFNLNWFKIDPVDLGGINKLINSDFNNGMANWTVNSGNGAGATSGVQGGSAYVWITTGGTNVWDIQLSQNTTITQGKRYKVDFDARITEGSTRTLSVNIEKNIAPWTNYGTTTFTLGTSWKHFTYTYNAVSASDAQARLVFQLGVNTSDVNVDNITLTEL